MFGTAVHVAATRVSTPRCVDALETSSEIDRPCECRVKRTEVSSIAGLRNRLGYVNERAGLPRGSLGGAARTSRDGGATCDDVDATGLTNPPADRDGVEPGLDDQALTGAPPAPT